MCNNDLSEKCLILLNTWPLAFTGRVLSSHLALRVWVQSVPVFWLQHLGKELLQPEGWMPQLHFKSLGLVQCCSWERCQISVTQGWSSPWKGNIMGHSNARLFTHLSKQCCTEGVVFLDKVLQPPGCSDSSKESRASVQLRLSSPSPLIYLMLHLYKLPSTDSAGFVQEVI